MFFHELEARRLLSFTPIGTEQIVPTPGLDKTYDMAVAGDGSFIIASIDDAATPKLMAVRYNASGEQVGSVLTLDTLISNFNGRAVSVSMDADGDAVVSYLRSTTEVDAIRISKTGIVSARQTIDTIGGNEAEFLWPSVSMDDSGDYFVGWLTYLSTGHDDTVHVHAYDAAGNSLAAEFVATPNSDLTNYSELDLQAKSDGSGAMFAYSVSAEVSADQIRFGIVTKTGISVPASALTNGNAPQIAQTASDSFAISYLRFGGGMLGSDQPNFSGFVQRIDSSGIKVGDEIALGADLPGADLLKHINNLSIAGTSDGGFVTAFTQLRTDRTWVFAERFGSDGVMDDSGTIIIDEPFADDPKARLTAVDEDANGRGVVTFLRGTDNVDQGGELEFRQITSDELINLHGDELQIIGRNGADDIRVTIDGDDVKIFRGDVFTTVRRDAVMRLSINGMGGNDSIVNETSLPSTIFGGDGIDTIVGGSGADFIRGNNGSDSISGGEGNDTLLGDGGLDSLSGNAGKDNVQGAAGNDRVAGNGGRDRLFGDDGDDRIYGGASGDWLFAGLGFDQLFGEGGDDRLYANDPTDTFNHYAVLHGNAGNDFFFTNDDLTDHLFGDGGHDSAVVDIHDALISIESAD